MHDSNSRYMLPYIWQHALLIPPPTLQYSSPNRSKNPKNKSPTKQRISFMKWMFTEKQIRRMGQKHKKVRQKELQG